MDLMLQTRPEIRVTHLRLKAAAKNPFGVEMLQICTIDELRGQRWTAKFSSPRHAKPRERAKAS
ncbi:hypothetical protein BDV38DRAFT_231893 [Aspergillus pseudotamarii]|uniref:Uncharacterized protein n=1 Tax=Aspergillus pseudotamarii TaxID=132259 RepID=A0A5N6TBX3_ASPPS|nr:uncharacterized protein BDV38DRAFT_231893 [Aspergillus pseudotamarii]KAE8143669.1 hypothetical protein BDV38DRAFT_231893 [Aspergillus pseudotamarii]